MKKYMVGILCILASVAVSHRAIASMDMVHPGILETKAQFRFVKNNLNSEPWKSAYEKILKDPRAKLDYKPTPWKTVECGSYSNPNFGCTDETRDASAAYTQVILWQLTGNTQYAENTRKILNAWAETLEGGHTNSNGPLQAAWSAETFTRAAEILEYTYAGWTKEEKAKVKKMFSEQYLPDIKRMFSGAYGCYNNNWQASGIEGMLNIGIFTRNEALFNEAIDKWKSLLPAYIYLKSDGPIPANTSWCSRPTSQIVGTWNNPTELTDGLSKESCRDFEHTAYGIAALINVAETAYIQGIDLYNDKETKAAERLQKTMELHAKYQNNDSGLPQLCKDYEGIKLNTVGTFEIGYNEYVVRKGNTLTETEVFLQRTRPTTGRFHYLWETMTHGLIGYAE